VSAPTHPEGPAIAAPAVAADECPRCRQPIEPGQEYCLECGARLPGPPTGVVAALGAAWRRRLRWYPGDWIWAALALLFIAALGALVAITASGGNSQETTIVATTSPGVVTRQAVETTPATTAASPTTAATATAPAATTETPAKPAAQTTLRVWPSGESGWTVVLRSEASRQGAIAQAHKAIHAGVRDVGVLDSAKYSSLHPGYFVVFAGVYATQAAAENGLTAAAAKGYPDAYVPRVSP